MVGNLRDKSRGVAGSESFFQLGVAEKKFRQRGQPPHRLGGNDVAYADQNVVLHGAAGIHAPFHKAFLKRTVGDHREEIVHERRPPARDKLALKVVVKRGELRAGKFPEIAFFQRRHDFVEAAHESLHAAIQRQSLTGDAYNGGADAQPLGPTRGTDQGLFPEGLLDTHHRLHEASVDAVAREHHQDPVPVPQVVVEAAFPVPEHFKGVRVGVNKRALHAERKAELAVNRRIHCAREGKSQGQRDAGIAFDDVGIVPENGLLVRVWKFGKRRDGARL